MRKLQTQGVHHITIVGADRQTSIDFWEGGRHALRVRAAEPRPRGREPPLLRPRRRAPDHDLHQRGAHARPGAHAHRPGLRPPRRFSVSQATSRRPSSGSTSAASTTAASRTAASWTRYDDRVHEAAVLDAAVVDAALVEPLDGLRERPDQKATWRTQPGSVGVRSGSGVRSSLGEDRDQAPVAGVEVEVALGLAVKVRGLEHEGRCQAPPSQKSINAARSAPTIVMWCTPSFCGFLVPGGVWPRGAASARGRRHAGSPRGGSADQLDGVLAQGAAAARRPSR